MLGKRKLSQVRASLKRTIEKKTIHLRYIVSKLSFKELQKLFLFKSFKKIPEQKLFF